MFKLFQKIKSSVEIKDTASSAVKVTYYSKCLNESDQLMQTNKCDGLQVQSNNVPLSNLHEYALPIDSNTLTPPPPLTSTTLAWKPVQILHGTYATIVFTISGSILSLESLVL